MRRREPPGRRRPDDAPSPHAKNARNRRSSSPKSLSSHSQTVSALQPSSLSFSALALSRARFLAILARQYSALAFGARAPRGQSWPCQKQPCTKSRVACRYRRYRVSRQILAVQPIGRRETPQQRANDQFRSRVARFHRPHGGGALYCVFAAHAAARSLAPRSKGSSRCAAMCRTAGTTTPSPVKW